MESMNPSSNGYISPSLGTLGRTSAVVTQSSTTHHFNAPPVAIAVATHNGRVVGTWGPIPQELMEHGSPTPPPPPEGSLDPQQISEFLVPANQPNIRASPTQEPVTLALTMGQGCWSPVTGHPSDDPSLPGITKTTKHIFPAFLARLLQVNFRASRSVTYGGESCRVWPVGKQLTAVLLIRYVRSRSRTIHLIPRAHE